MYSSRFSKHWGMMHIEYYNCNSKWVTLFCSLLFDMWLNNYSLTIVKVTKQKSTSSLLLSLDVSWHKFWTETTVTPLRLSAPVNVKACPWHLCCRVIVTSDLHPNGVGSPTPHAVAGSPVIVLLPSEWHIFDTYLILLSLALSISRCLLCCFYYI